jgi:hypothetical protein
VNRIGNNLFTGAALSGNKNGGGAWRNLFDNP